MASGITSLDCIFLLDATQDFLASSKGKPCYNIVQDEREGRGFLG